MLNRLFSNNMIKRIISGAIIVAFTLASLLGSKILLTIYLTIIFIFMSLEWSSIASSSKKDLISGYSAIFTAIFSLLIISLFKFGNLVLLWLFITIWSFDTFALIGGKIIGGKKLAENISPKKTWSGLISGVLGAIITVSIIEKFMFQDLPIIYTFFSKGFIFPSILFCILGQAGDLLESYYKRKYDVKDSGSFIPGHGGFLDRYDSFLLSSPILLILIFL